MDDTCIEQQRCADMFSFMHVKAFLGEKQDPRLHVANNKHLLTYQLSTGLL